MRNLDEYEAFELIEISEEHEYDTMKFEYRKYIRKK